MTTGENLSPVLLYMLLTGKAEALRSPLMSWKWHSLLISLTLASGRTFRKDSYTSPNFLSLSKRGPANLFGRVASIDIMCPSLSFFEEQTVIQTPHHQVYLYLSPIYLWGPSRNRETFSYIDYFKTLKNTTNSFQSTKLCKFTIS